MGHLQKLVDFITLFSVSTITIPVQSVDTRSKVGYGAYLAVYESGLPIDTLRTRVKVRRFVPTSSSKLELQTLLWAISEIQALVSGMIVYTDSQNIIGLQGRRDRFEKIIIVQRKISLSIILSFTRSFTE
jgi:hypothetical protein